MSGLKLIYITASDSRKYYGCHLVVNNYLTRSSVAVDNLLSYGVQGTRLPFGAAIKENTCQI